MDRSFWKSWWHFIVFYWQAFWETFPLFVDRTGKILDCLYIVGALVSGFVVSGGWSAWAIWAGWSFAALFVVMFMRSVHKKYQKVMDERDGLAEDLRKSEEFGKVMVVVRDLLKKRLLDARPAVEQYEYSQKLDQYMGRMEPLRTLARELGVLSSEVTAMALAKTPLPRQAGQEPGLAEMIRAEITADQKLVIYEKEYATNVLTAKAKVERAFKLSNADLDAYCREKDRTVETIKNIGQGLEALKRLVESEIAEADRAVKKELGLED